MIKHLYNSVLKLGIGKILSILFTKVQPAAVLAPLLLITLFWASFLPELRFNYDIESFFSTADPEVELYYNHRDTFENENDFVLLGIRNNKGIFNEPFLIALDSLTHELKQVSGIRKVFSPTNLYETINTPLGPLREPLIHIHSPEMYHSDSTRIFSSGIYPDAFFSENKHSVSLLLRKNEQLTRKQNDSLLTAITQITANYGFDEFHLAGRIRTQNYYVSKMQNQMVLFGALTTVLFWVSLFAVFRRTVYVLIAFISVLVSLIWIFGIMAYFGIAVDLLLTLMPSLIFIISTSAAIHLITRFKNELKSTGSGSVAVLNAVFHTGIPNFLNALTTSIGFASLVFIPVMPIKIFGLLVAVGIMISFFTGILLIPSLLRTFRPRNEIRPTQNLKTGKGGAGQFVNNSGWILGSFSLVFALGTVLTFNVKVNNQFLDDLNPSSSLKKDLDFFEENFSGIRPFEMNVRGKNGHQILEHDALTEMEMVEDYLKNEYGAGFLFSPLTIIKSANKAMNGGDQAAFKIPGSPEELEEIIGTINKRKLWNRFFPVMNKGISLGRISGRTNDDGASVYRKRNEDLFQFIAEKTQYLDYAVTGAAHLMDNANSQIAWNLMLGILIAIGVSTLVIGLFTRSWKLSLLSLVPNLLPLLLVSGIMGAMGIPLKVSTSLIFTIAYGIAVDDTIHFLNAFRKNRKRYSGVSEAVRRTVYSIWKPMLYTSVVLLSGFLIFSLSEFSSISLLGILISIALFVALIADLVLLPALLKKFIKN